VADISSVGTSNDFDTVVVARVVVRVVIGSRELHRGVSWRRRPAPVEHWWLMPGVAGAG